jgi:hypothetical protein
MQGGLPLAIGDVFRYVNGPFVLFILQREHDLGAPLGHSKNKGLNMRWSFNLTLCFGNLHHL